MSESFPHLYRELCRALLATTPVNIGEWQSMDVSGSKVHATYELLDVGVGTALEPNLDVLRATVQPNMPWADQHFAERVGGQPVNPPPSHVNWPWSRHNAQHQNGEAKAFSHSYPERFWPKHAGDCHASYAYTADGGVQTVDAHGQGDVSRVCDDRMGIRYAYGDLQDVVDLLLRSPLTRQAYVPIWFPEDTGAVHRERVPCTLGYHFMIRDGKLDIRYYMRSCDIIRHFRDDVYMAVRLGLWMVDQINNATPSQGFSELDGDPSQYISLEPGSLIMYITSLHAFAGDKHALERGARD